MDPDADPGGSKTYIEDPTDPNPDPQHWLKMPRNFLLFLKAPASSQAGGGGGGGAGGGFGGGHNWGQGHRLQ
jgi:hypothetical protein